MLEGLSPIQVRVLANGKAYQVIWMLLERSINGISYTLDGVMVAAKYGWSISAGGGKAIPARSIQAILIERVL